MGRLDQHHYPRIAVMRVVADAIRAVLEKDPYTYAFRPSLTEGRSFLNPMQEVVVARQNCHQTCMIVRSPTSMVTIREDEASVRAASPGKVGREGIMR